MEIYNEGNKLKTNELRVTRPIGALLIGMSQPFSALTNETINVYIERIDGENTEILPADYPLAKFIALSTQGQSAIIEDDNGLKALCEISEQGSVNLQENENIRIKLDGLKSAVTYSINGIEYPQSGNSVSVFSRKQLIAGESSRRFDVSEQEMLVIDGVDSILEMNVQFSNGRVCKYVPEEIKCISRDLDPVKLVRVGADNETSFDLPSALAFPLVEVANIEVTKKIADPVSLYLKNNVEAY